MKSEVSLAGRVEIRDGHTGEVLWRSANEVQTSGRKLVMDFLRGEPVEGVKLLAVEDEAGEIWRILPTNVSDPTDTSREYEFFLTEQEPPDPPHSLKALKLMAGDATLEPDTGTEYAKVAVSREKKVNQSLTIVWTISAVKG